jgi:hypothetical protein
MGQHASCQHVLLVLATVFIGLKAVGRTRLNVVHPQPRAVADLWVLFPPDDEPSSLKHFGMQKSSTL